MERQNIPIGEAAKRSAVKVPTIRYYEEIGLLPRVPRTNGGRRIYDTDLLRRLTFIRHARELGFEIDSVRALLALQDDPAQSCRKADAIARARLAEVERRIARLHALKRELKRMIMGCRMERIAECRVIEALTDHRQRRKST